MHIKITLRCHYIATKIGKIIKGNMTTYSQEAGPTVIPMPSWKDRNWYNHSERWIDIIYYRRTYRHFIACSSSPMYMPERYVYTWTPGHLHRDIHSREQPKYPSTTEWVKNWEIVRHGIYNIVNKQQPGWVSQTQCWGKEARHQIKYIKI